MAVIVLSFLSAGLWVADSIWKAHSNASEQIYRLLILDLKAGAAQINLIRHSDQLEKYHSGDIETLRDLNDAIISFNELEISSDWVSRRLLSSPEELVQKQKFASQTRRMSVIVERLINAETSLDIAFYSDSLANQLKYILLGDSEARLHEEQLAIEEFHEHIDTIAWLSVILLAGILGLIWFKMIAPTLEKQEHINAKLRESEIKALEIADIANQANDSKDQMLTVLSHELRTPFNALIGYSETLMNEQLPAKTREAAESILENSVVLNEMLDGLVDISDKQGFENFNVHNYMNSVRQRQQQRRAKKNDAHSFTLPEGLKILIADDNKTNRTILTTLIKRMKGTATVVEDGVDAVSAYKEQGFDLLLLDIAMPNKRGDQALIDIRQHEKDNECAPAVAIAVTANTLEHQRDTYRRAGFNDIMAKPIRFAGISKVLEGYYSKVPHN
ncbi:hybrid sensor histidine kinase/response regulator [Amylibacter marinus]|nr:response regulator [Amylibacter marinus]